MTTQRGRTKPPAKTRTVCADDFTVVVDGETYYPHAGESVTFKGRLSVGLYLELTRLDQAETGLDLLASAITEWSFTDDEGRAYASPPTVEVLKALPAEELGWLIAASRSERKEEEVKNASSPSS